MGLVNFAVKSLSNAFCTPYLFQRDDKLYAVSDFGFAEIRNLPDINGTDSITSWDGDSWSKKPVFKPEEEKYMQAITHKNDNSYCSIESMTEVYKELSKLDNDKNIRMINHSVHHSSGDSGGPDSNDIYITKAQVMNLEKYLGIISKHEDNSFGSFEKIVKGLKYRIDFDRHPRQLYDSELGYLCGEMASQDIPFCTIFTPNVILTLPVNINYRTYQWFEDSRFSIDKFSLPDTGLPLSLFFTTNSRFFKANHALEMDNIISCFVSPYTNFFNKIQENIKEIAPFISKLNELYSKEFPSNKKELIL